MLKTVSALCCGLLVCVLTAFGSVAQAADKALLDILLKNGAITQEQYESLVGVEELSAEDLRDAGAGANVDPAPAEETPAAQPAETQINLAEEADSSLNTSYGSNGFRLETRDGNFQTNLQWRAQLRASTPFSSDPRQLSAFDAEDTTDFEARRLRMKIGGHGFQPWLRYYFEVDLQPSRDVDDSSASASARVIDWRVDIAKWDWGGIRVGQWKIDLNRERVDSSGRQQFVERSIVNRVFTIDRQIGVQLRGRAFKGTPADLRYWVGAFNGEGRGVSNNGGDLLYMGRLQWNFLGRDLAWRQTDVEYTDLPTGSLAVGRAMNTGSCTRWSSSGCGNLDGFESPATAAADQFEIDQTVQEFAFKYRGLSIQQEYHWKSIRDRSVNSKFDLTGGYLQAGYFFHHLNENIPEPLEIAFRLAEVKEPNAVDRTFENRRREFTIGANWFFNEHRNKLTLDFSRLEVDDRLLGLDDSGNRVRFQWDVSL